MLPGRGVKAVVVVGLIAKEKGSPVSRSIHGAGLVAVNWYLFRWSRGVSYGGLLTFVEQLLS